MKQSQNLDDIKPRGFDLQPIIIQRIFKMKLFINWKTTLLGLAIAIIKFLGPTFGLTPDLITSIITILTALLGLTAADSVKSLK